MNTPDSGFDDPTISTVYPRVRQLPTDEQGPFWDWLISGRHCRPLIEGIPWNSKDQDCYWSSDLARWRAGK